MSSFVVRYLLAFFLSASSVITVAEVPDIIMLSYRPNMGESVLIGGARLPWGTRFILNGDQAATRRGNRCGFTFAYDLVNAGNQSLPVRATSVSSSQQPLHLGQPFVLRVGDKKTVSGIIYLSNGLNDVQFRVEAASGVVEKTAAVLLAGC